ncbi:MAG: phosphatase PAP2 family protein [Pseudomonadota bacterium]
MLKKIFLYLLFFSQVFFVSNNAYAKRSNLTVAGDITQILVPAAGLGVATYYEDREGQKEFIKSFVVNTGLLFALKYSMKDTKWGKRPNGGRESFPSGHSAAAFHGAFFMQNRYGSKFGIPGMALASFTGYTRIEGDYHHLRDVLGGAALAFGVTYFMVDKYNNADTVKISTEVDKKAALIDFKMAL